MSDLQTLVETIVSDLIEARFEADVRAAELAALYREHPVLRNLAVPTLNIANVSVALQVAFDEGAIEAYPGPSEAQKKAVSEAAAILRDGIVALTSVTDTVSVPRQKAALSRGLVNRTTKAATDRLGEPPGVLRAEVERQVNALLSANGVRLNARDVKAAAEALDRFEQVVRAAPKPRANVPGLVVGAESLAKVPPEAVSTISFDVELSAASWVETADENGERRSVLSNR